MKCIGKKIINNVETNYTLEKDSYNSYCGIILLNIQRTPQNQQEKYNTVKDTVQGYEQTIPRKKKTNDSDT